MSRRRRVVVGLFGIIGVAAAVTAMVTMRHAGHKARKPAAVVIDTSSPLPVLARALREGDAKGLAAVYQRVMSPAQGTVKAVGEAEANDWVDVLVGMRTGYMKFSPYGRASSMAAATRILDRFTMEPAPVNWVRALKPTHDLLSTGMADTSPDVRTAAASEVARLWIWTPGKSMNPAEETALGEWKESFHACVLSCLADPQPRVRMAAVACLAALPFDSLAEPAVAYIADPNPDVRRQVLVAFGNRPSLLSVETVLTRLSDADPSIPPLAEEVLKARGLNQDQIGLGALIAHPRAELRESVIPLVINRTDIDPVIWLTQLSRDKEESVRLKAAEALAGCSSSDARLRLAEMAVSDPSPKVKARAARLVAPAEETAALPPLPGSPSLTPKAN